MRIYDLTVNGAKNCNVLPLTGLRASWKMESGKNNTMQQDYRICVCKGENSVFDTGVVTSDESVEIELAGLTLESGETYTISVNVTDNYGETASVSSVICGELDANDWNGAVWIKPKRHISGWAPYLRTNIVLKEDAEIAKAEMWGCGLGVGEFYVNGQRTDDSYIDVPGTNYEKVVLYRKYDIKGLVKNGGNAVAVLLGEGFYSQSRVWGHRGFNYGDVCVIAKIKITYADGTVDVFVTNTDTWKYKYSPIITNNIYAGETYDCRQETPDFAMYGIDESEWGPVIEDTTPKGSLKGCVMPPVVATRELPCVEVHCSSGKSDGAWIFDLGENFAGIYEVKIPSSPVGAVYTIRTAEVLNAQGDLDHRSTGAFATQCIQQEIYISRGNPEGEVYRPRFTYHGFRYVEITGIHDFSKGYGTMPSTDMIKGIQLTTGFEDTASFSSSCADLDKLYGIMKNTFRSNFHGYPEDCPAREKCGWLGDAEVVCNFGLLTYDAKSSYEKYMEDIRTSRDVYGVWQMIAPGKRGCGEATPLWGCAQIIIPYYMWKYYGDRYAITSNIEYMRDWMTHEINRAPDCIISAGLGDWCPPEGNDSPRRIPVNHSSTFMFYETAIRMAEISRAFGYGDEATYDDLADKIRASINKHFYSEKQHSYGYWASNAVALQLGVYPDGEHDALVKATIDMIRAEKHVMSTGIYGNKYLIPVLFDEGFGDDALKILFNREATSFGTMMDDSATTIWECLEMHHVEKSRKEVSSYDHPMHGGFIYAYYTKIAGIEPVEPGFKKFRVNPCHCDSLTNVKCTITSPYGPITVSYEKAANGEYTYSVTHPANTELVD